MLFYFQNLELLMKCTKQSFVAFLYKIVAEKFSKEPFAMSWIAFYWPRELPLLESVVFSPKKTRNATSHGSIQMRRVWGPLMVNLLAMVQAHGGRVGLVGHGLHVSCRHPLGRGCQTGLGFQRRAIGRGIFHSIGRSWQPK